MITTPTFRPRRKKELPRNGLVLHTDLDRGIPPTGLDSDYKVSALWDMSARYKLTNNPANHLSQTTGSAMPLLSRADNQGNLVAHSDEMDDAVWTQTEMTVTADVAANPVDGLTTADRLTDNTNSTLHRLQYLTDIKIPAGGAITVSVHMKEETLSSCRMVIDGSSGSHYAYVDFDLNAGSASSVTSGGSEFSGLSRAIEDVGSGWYRCSISLTTSNGTIGALNLRLGSGTTYVGSNESLLAYGMQLVESSWSSAYVSNNTNSPLYAGINGHRSLVFDGSNDHLEAASNIDYIEFTVAAVVRPLATGINNTILAQWITSNTEFIFRITSGNQLQIFWSDSGGNQQLLSTGTITAGTWYWIIAGVSNGAQFLRSNLEAEKTSSVAGTLTNSGSEVLTLGSQNTSPTNTFNGQIAEAAMWTRYMASDEADNLESYLTGKYPSIS